MKRMILISAAVILAALLGSCSKSESGAGDQVTVIFNAMEGVFANGESTLDTIIYAGDRIAAPADPVRDGYIFECWCAERSCITPVNFPVLVSSDKVFFAKWKLNPDKWLISGMLIRFEGVGVTSKRLYATYSYDDNNVLTSITCFAPNYDYNSVDYSNPRIPLIFKYDGDNVNVITTTGSITDTVASMKLRNGQCQSMAFENYDAYESKDVEMNFTYDASGYLKSAKLDTVKNTVMEWADVNIKDYCYSDFKLRYHDTTEAGIDTTWTVSVSYSNSDIVDITGSINIFSPLYLTTLFLNSSESLSDAIPFLFTSPYFETPSACLPKAFSIIGEGPSGVGVGEVIVLDGYRIDREEGYVTGIGYISSGQDFGIYAQFSYVEKK